MSDFSRAAIIAAELIEHLENSYDGEEIEIGEVMVLVEITGRNEEEGDWTAINFRCSDPRHWIQQGMLHAAMRYPGTPRDS